MSHFNIKLDLSKLNHVIREVPKKGGGTTKVIIIDIASNNLFLSDKGSLYIDLIAFENNEVRYGNTHSIKQSLSKSVRDSMTEEQQKSTPFIGNMKPTGANNQAAETTGQSDNSFGEMPDFSAPSSSPNTSSVDDDLPF